MNKKTFIPLGIMIFVAVFAGTFLGISLKPEKQVVVNIPEIQIPESVGNPVEMSFGSFNRKTISATSSQITVTATPTSLKSLIQTADSTMDNSYFNGINTVVVQPSNGNIRYLIGSSSLITDAVFSAGTSGGLIYQTNKEPISANPNEIYLVRDSAETSNVTVEVPVFGINNY